MSMGPVRLGIMAGAIPWSGLWLLALSLLGAYVAFGVILFVLQGRLVYFPEKQLAGTPHDIGLAYEAITLRTEDQVEIFAWYVPVAGSRGTILFCHGNAGNISHRLAYLEIFHRLGLSTFIFDYRGFGLSEGYPAEQGTYLDSEAAWGFLVGRKGISPGSIVLYGESLGGPVAARLAARHSPGALILASTFTSLPDLGAALYPLFPVRLLSRFNYDTLEFLRQVRCPTLIIHSPDDEIVPFRQAKALADAMGALGELLTIRGDHNSGFIMSRDLYVEGIEGFLAGRMRRPASPGE